MELLTVKEVAVMLKVSEQTVRKYLAQGDMSGVCVGRRIRIPKQHLGERLTPK